MNEVLVALGLSPWKSVLGALLLPPVPWLALLVLAWVWRLRHQAAATLLLLVSLAGLWLSHCQATGLWLERVWATDAALAPARMPDLRRSLAGRPAVVLVLGGGVVPLAPEYGESHLTDSAYQRLHYGLWLGRQIGQPLMVTGRAGPDAPAGVSEASIAHRLLNRDHGVDLRWQEGASRDTRENARFSLRLLQAQGVQQVLLVTQGWHMPRAMRAFRQEAQRMGYTVVLQAAPMGMGRPSGLVLMQWIPSPDGYRRVHQVLREMLGWVSGA